MYIIYIVRSFFSYLRIHIIELWVKRHRKVPHERRKNHKNKGKTNAFNDAKVLSMCFEHRLYFLGFCFHFSRFHFCLEGFLGNYKKQKNENIFQKRKNVSKIIRKNFFDVKNIDHLTVLMFFLNS